MSGAKAPNSLRGSFNWPTSPNWHLEQYAIEQELAASITCRRDQLSFRRPRLVP